MKREAAKALLVSKPVQEEEDPPIFLYRRCRDGSLATVVRRKELPPVSKSSLVLTRPKLPLLDFSETQGSAQQTSRELTFQYPYMEFQAMVAQSPKSTKISQKQWISPKRLEILSPSTSLRDRNESIIERLEVSRQHFDLIEKRKARRQLRKLTQNKVFPFQVQPLSRPPAFSENLTQQKVTRRPPALAHSRRILQDLGFEDENQEIETKLRMFTRVDQGLETVKSENSLTSVQGKKRNEGEKFHQQETLYPKVYTLRDEASQYLQEEFRQLLSKGYISKLQNAQPLTLDPLTLRMYRGLELI